MPNPIEIDEVTLVAISEKDSTELTEQELSEASGGGLFRACCVGQHIPKVKIEI